MSMMARAFIAVVPPSVVLDAVEELAGSCRASITGARWIPREQWHLTVQFLGNRVDLDATAAALASLQARSAELRLGRLGAFPSTRRARVLWTGVVDGTAWWRELATEVARVLAATGFVPEHRDPEPHLTLARFRAAVNVRDLVAASPSSVGPAWRVGEVVLFESITTRHGVHYEPRVAVPLG
jgi:2'-5' RNA ligase